MNDEHVGCTSDERSDASSIAASAGGGAIHVLIVDDDLRVVHSIARLLELEGFRTETVASGEEAVERLRASCNAYDVVLLDLGLPGIGGEATLEALHALCPEVPVVICSGSRPNLTDYPLAAAFLPKPARIAEMRAIIEGALRDGNPGSKARGR